MNSIGRGVARGVIAQASLADLQTHDSYGIHYLRYRVDEAALTESRVGVVGKP